MMTQTKKRKPQNNQRSIAAEGNGWQVLRDHATRDYVAIVTRDDVGVVGYGTSSDEAFALIAAYLVPDQR